jgi:hypothetical protein
MRLWYRGKLLNTRTIAMLEAAEERLGYSLHVMQGSYNRGGVSASAGTHDGGGALDVSATSNQSKVVRALREVGFAAWHRLPSQGPWGEHIHAIAIGDPDLSSGARTQVREYYAGQNGLANHRRDDGPRLSPIPVWPVRKKTISLKNVRAAFSSKAEYPKSLPGVQRIQHMLNKKLGLDLIEDGVAGPKTREAYKKWERKLDPKWVKGVPGEKNLKVLVDGYYTVV